ncbi:oxidase ustYa family protein [Aspergillus ibericus CBS 121593]|uniref:Uncharacterized protein n=1 Tax=Aspergillus ibericus CBS 121593 TaxID=1448316 RepID=A0A395GPI8_9EURO|nr:hypothetical protein BO80DRAFT_428761 [Aspergillus ibericus CBS 121593]RAK96757.1 hypothetical protein BO80DRAFT_428761 [Aspergillus ibericus CBS 121593]
MPLISRPVLFHYLSSFILCSGAICLLILSFARLLNGTACNNHFYSWSPAKDVISYHWTFFNNTPFFTEDEFFKLELSADLEQAWADFLPHHPIAIPRGRMTDLNQSLDLTFAQSGDHILALPEVFVQLHCLHFLWQFSHRQEYDYSNLASSSPERLTERANQCVERLRRAIMCWADPGVYIKQRINGTIGVDLDTYHRCRNFEDIRQWTLANGVKSVYMHDGWWNVSLVPDQ